MQIIKNENKIVYESWNTTLFYIIYIDDNDSHHRALIQIENCEHHEGGHNYGAFMPNVSPMYW